MRVSAAVPPRGQDPASAVQTVQSDGVGIVVAVGPRGAGQYRVSGIGPPEGGAAPRCGVGQLVAGQSFWASADMLPSAAWLPPSPPCSQVGRRFNRAAVKGRQHIDRIAGPNGCRPARLGGILRGKAPLLPLCFPLPLWLSHCLCLCFFHRLRSQDTTFALCFRCIRSPRHRLSVALLLHFVPNFVPNFVPKTRPHRAPLPQVPETELTLAPAEVPPAAVLGMLRMVRMDHSIPMLPPVIICRRPFFLPCCLTRLQLTPILRRAPSSAFFEESG